MLEYSDYRGLKKQIRRIKLEQGGILDPVIVIGHESHLGTSTEASDNENSTAGDGGIRGPVIIISGDTATETLDYQGRDAKSSTDEDTLGPVIVIGRDSTRDTVTEPSNNDTTLVKSGRFIQFTFYLHRPPWPFFRDWPYR